LGGGWSPVSRDIAGDALTDWRREMEQPQLTPEPEERGATEPAFMTIAQAARRVRCSERTVRRAIDSGALRAGHQRGARPHRERPRRRSRRDPRASRQGRQAARGRHGSMGLGTPSALALIPRPDSGRSVVLRHRRPHTRPAADIDERAPAAAAHGGEGGRAQTVRAPPAASRARRRDDEGGRALERHPAPARARKSRDHVHLPAGDRQRGDHRHRSRSARADDPGQRWPTPTK